MSRHLPLRALLTAVFFVGSVSCGGGNSAPSGPPVQLPVSSGTWYLHTANSLALPAAISDRFIGVSPEQTLLDSARLLVNSNGSYQQILWMRVMINGSLDRAEVVLDEGVWSTFAGQNSFHSTVRQRLINASSPTPDVIATSEQVLFWTGAPLISGVYRRSRP